MFYVEQLFCGKAVLFTTVPCGTSDRCQVLFATGDFPPQIGMFPTAAAGSWFRKSEPRHPLSPGRTLCPLVAILVRTCLDSGTQCGVQWPETALEVPRQYPPPTGLVPDRSTREFPPGTATGESQVSARANCFAFGTCAVPIISASLPPGLTRLRAIGNELSNRSTARMVTSSATPENASARAPKTLTFLNCNAETTSFRNAAFFACDSISVTRAPGACIASGIPGNPAPEPRSIAVPAQSAVTRCEAAKKDSPKCRVTISSGSRTAVRFILRFHFRRRSTYIDIFCSCAALRFA